MRLSRRLCAALTGVVVATAGIAPPGIAPPPARAAATWYVGDGVVEPSLANVPAGCLDPDEARLHDVVARVTPGDTIYLCPGTHVLDAGVVVPDPPPDAVEPRLSLRGHSADDTTVTRRTDAGAAAFRLITAASWIVELRDLTLSNGLAPGTASGGAVSATQIDAERIVARDNAAALGGALTAERVSLSDSTLVGNAAHGFEGEFVAQEGLGGAVHADTVSVTSSTFTRNAADDAGPKLGQGGAISARFVTVVDSSFSENTASLGGAILNGPMYDIRGSTFERNTARARGGALYSSHGSGWGTLTDSAFRENTAGTGGAVALEFVLLLGDHRWTDVTFSGNEAAGYGGAVWFRPVDVASNDSGLLITRGQFEDNVAGLGGAIAGVLVFAVDSTFRRNTAWDRGGAIIGAPHLLDPAHSELPPILSFQRSTFEANVAESESGEPGSGGAIASSDTFLVVDSSTFVANRAHTGGAIQVERPAGIQFSTFVDNVGTDGSVLAGQDVVMGNSILVADPSGPACATGLVLQDTGGILSTDTSCPVTRPESPHVGRSEVALRPLANHGGSVSTMPPAPASVAVNAGVLCEVQGTAESIMGDWLDVEGHLNGFASFLFSEQDATGATRPDGGCDSGAVERVTPSTLYVGRDGMPDAGGSCTTPDLADPVVAVDRTIPGDTVHLCAGTLTLTSPMAPASRITIRGDGPGASIVDGGGSVPLVEALGDSDVTVRDLTMRNGLSAAAGGAITADRVTARNVEFEGNEAGFAGGAIAGREVDVRDSTFTGNTARVGGAVLASGSLTLVNSTLAGNHALVTAGAVSAAAGRITHTTFVDNAADTGDRAVAGGVAIGNSLVADDTAGDLCGAGVVDDGGNVVTDGSCLATTTTSTQAAYSELELGDLAVNGGTTRTVPLGTLSRAIDAGRLDDCLGSEAVATTDQRGIARPQGAGCDAGAYEWQDDSCAAGPVAGDVVLAESLRLLEDEPFRIAAATVLAASACVGGAMLQIGAVPDGWAVTLDGLDVVATPARDDAGPFSITFRLTDGEAVSTASLSGTQVGVNDAPALDLCEEIVVLDSGPTRAPCGTATPGGGPDEAAQVVAVALSGVPGEAAGLFLVPPTASIEADGSVSVQATPTLGASGSVDLVVTASDDGGIEDGGVDRVTARLRLTVVPDNEPPAAANDRYDVVHATPLAVTAPGVLGNDDDPDDDGLTAVLVADVEHGSLVLHTDGSFVYQPAAGFAGLDEFRYAASDGAARAEAVVTLAVATPAASPPPRPRPTASADSTPRPIRAPTPSPTASATAAPTPSQTATGSPAAPTVPASTPSATPPASIAPAPSASPSPPAGPVAPDLARGQGADWMPWAVLGLLGLVGLTVVGIGALFRRRP